MTSAPFKYAFAHADDFDKIVNKIIKKVPHEVADTHFHPSSFGHWCRRREVLRLLKQHLKVAVPRSKPAPGLQRIFAIGNAVHDHFRDTVFSELLRGSWVCRRCGQTTEKDAPCPKKCSTCGNTRYHSLWHAFSYKEESLVYPEAQLSGSYDGLIEYRDRLRVLELKSIREDLFKTLQAPYTGHVVQAHAYGIMLRATGRDIKSALIVYVNKSSGATKAFLVGFMPEVSDWLLKEIAAARDLAKENYTAVRTVTDIGILAQGPEFTARAAVVCTSPTTSRAKSCASCSECFAGKRKEKKHGIDQSAQPEQAGGEEDGETGGEADSAEDADEGSGS